MARNVTQQRYGAGTLVHWRGSDPDTVIVLGDGPGAPDANYVITLRYGDITYVEKFPRRMIVGQNDTIMWRP